MCVCSFEDFHGCHFHQSQTKLKSFSPPLSSLYRILQKYQKPIPKNYAAQLINDLKNPKNNLKCLLGPFKSSPPLQFLPSPQFLLLPNFSFSPISPTSLPTTMVLSLTSLPINYGFTIGLISSLLINRIADFLHRQKWIYPKNVLEADNEYYYWRYRNFFVSFVHASMTGIGSLFVASQTPRIMIDVIDTYSEFGYVLTSFSFGYFIYDTLEMFTHGNYKGTTELIIHHILILMCFANTMAYRRFIGYNMIALMIENSNIFLHFRQLLLLSNYPKSGPYYQVNCVVNIVMFILIRGSCMFWLWYTLLLNLSIIPLITKIVALTAMSGISVTTVILFKRVFNSDFILENGRISRKISSPKSAQNGDGTKNSAENGAAQPGQSPDLYEPMEDTYQASANDVAKEPPGKPTNGFRQRFHGAADHVAAAAEAVSN